MSKSFSLNSTDFQKIGKGAAIAAGGAVLTYALTVIPQIDFGQYTPLAVALFSTLINAALKFFESQRSTK
jgi:hypothetical protein